MPRRTDRVADKLSFIYCKTCGNYGKAFFEHIPVNKRAEKRKTWKNFMKNDTLYWNTNFFGCVEKRHKVEVALTATQLRNKLSYYMMKHGVNSKRFSRPRTI